MVSNTGSVCSLGQGGAQVGKLNGVIAIDEKNCRAGVVASLSGRGPRNKFHYPKLLTDPSFLDTFHQHASINLEMKSIQAVTRLN